MNGFGMRALHITREELPRWQPQLEALEQTSVYPLGDDAFRISHGADYFAFFERMGAVHYHALEHEGRLVAVGCGVLRERPRRWYLSDVKVHPDFRGQRLPLKLLRAVFLPNWLRCGRGYAIAMNPPDGAVPRSIRVFSHFRWVPKALVHAFALDLYSAPADATRAALPLIGPGGFVSLRGIKDLVLESTRQRFELLHFRRDAGGEPQTGATHMWCVPREAPLNARLAAAGFMPSASATVIWHRLGGFDWSTLDTSEI
jgi:hypothetical protein